MIGAGIFSILGVVAGVSGTHRDEVVHGSSREFPEGGVRYGCLPVRVERKFGWKYGRDDA